MPDVWATFTELDAALQERLAGVLETRGADFQQQSMRRTFLSNIPFPENAHVLEVGCGTGVLTRVLGREPNVGGVVGVDVAPSLLSRARELAADLPNVTFQEADARALPALFKRTKVALAEGGADAGVIGAAVLAAQEVAAPNLRDTPLP